MRKITIAAFAAAAMACGMDSTSSAGVSRSTSSITFGVPDGSGHPYVGALLADLDPNSPGVEQVCSGTLIAPTVFLTAGHCTAFLETHQLAAYVTFLPAWDETTASLDGAIGGTAHTHPMFACCGANDRFDVGVVVLASPSTSIAPAHLATAGLLDSLQAEHELLSATFVTVGYGAVRTDKEKGPASIRFLDPIRRVTEQSALSLTDAWFTLSMQPATGDGGTCYGDSGGPHLLGASDVVVSVTGGGDRYCRATDKTYRVDTPAARAFLAEYVTLP